MTAADRSIGGSVERGLGLGIGLVLLVRTVVFAGDVLRQDRSDHASALAVAAIVLVSVATARCLLGYVTSFDVLLCVVALVVAMQLPYDGVPPAGTPESPFVHLVAPMLLVVVSRRRFAVLKILLIAGLFVALRWQTAPDDDGLVLGLQEAALSAGYAFGALVLVGALRSASERAHRMLAHRQAEVAAAMSAQEVEATSFLHDDLIPTLVTVSTVPDSPDSLASASNALRVLSDEAAEPADADLPTALSAMAERAGVEAELVVRGHSAGLPVVVRDALLGAAGEALRNVVRHSGQARATVTLTRRPGRIRITIDDPGVGFVVAPGVGLRVAVAARVEAVGGHAEIDSTPGRGTTVELSWRSRRLERILGISPDNDDLVRRAVGNPGRVALRSCAALAAGFAATAGLLLIDGPPRPWTYGGAVAVAVLLALVVAIVWRRPAPPWLLVLVAVVPAVVLAVVLAPLPAGELGGIDSWIIGFAALPALAAAWVTSRRVVVAVLVPSAVVIAVVALDTGLSDAALAHLLLVQPLSALFVAIVVAECRAVGRSTLGTGPDDLTARPDIMRRLLEPVLPEVVRVLEDPTAPGAAEAAGRLAKGVRDCLYLPGRAHLTLRSALDRLRRTGATVDIILREPLQSSEQLAIAIDGLLFLGPGQTPGQAPRQVTVSGDPRQVSVVVVPALVGGATGTLLSRLPHTWSATLDPDATIVTGPPTTVLPSVLAALTTEGVRQPLRG